MRRLLSTAGPTATPWLQDPKGCTIRAKTVSSILKSIARHPGIGVQEPLQWLDLL